MGIPLDNLEDANWIDAKMAEKERTPHEEFEARIAQYNADIDTHSIHEEARQSIPGHAKESKQRNAVGIWEQEAKRKSILRKKSKGTKRIVRIETNGVSAASGR